MDFPSFLRCVFSIRGSQRDCLAASSELELYRILVDLTASTVTRVARLKNGFPPIPHIRLAIPPGLLGHFLDTFSVQRCLFLFQTRHTRSHIFPRNFSLMIGQFRTLAKKTEQRNQKICNQQVVGSNPTAGSSLA